MCSHRKGYCNVSFFHNPFLREKGLTLLSFFSLEGLFNSPPPFPGPGEMSQISIPELPSFMQNHVTSYVNI